MWRRNEVYFCLVFCITLCGCHTVPGATSSAISDVSTAVEQSRDELTVAQGITDALAATVTEIGERESSREALIANTNQRSITDVGDLEAILAAIRELVEDGIRECESGREDDKSP